MKRSWRFANTKHAKQVIVIAIVCSMLLVLPSCGIPPFRKAVPGQLLPADYPAALPGANNPEQNSSQLGIREFFNDPLLTSLIDQGLANNQELKILNEDVQIAKAQILARQGGYLPLVRFRSLAGLDKPSRFTPIGAAERELEYLPGKHFPDPLPDFLLSLNYIIPLDIWREYRNARDAAVQRYLSTCERRNYFVTRMVADIAENYYGLMARDKRIENLNQIIRLQEQSLEIAKAKKEAARGTELAVLRFEAEVRKNQSERLIVQQEIIEVENRINFLAGRFPQPVARQSVDFIDLNIHALNLGIPAQLLHNRPDIRGAERELAAAGFDVKVARARFFPALDITGYIGYEAFNPRYLFWTPDALIGNVAGELVAPLLNKNAIQAEYLTANARQLQTVYDYQRVILNAFTEVVNRMSGVENYRRSIEIRKQQLQALQSSVEAASNLYQAARAEYLEVLIAQRDLFEARRVLIDTKLQQLSAVVNTYQALGGGLLGCNFPDPGYPQQGPTLEQARQGGNAGADPEQLHAPRIESEKPSAPGKPPEQPPGPNPAQPGQFPEVGKLPTHLPSPGPSLE